MVVALLEQMDRDVLRRLEQPIQVAVAAVNQLRVLVQVRLVDQEL